MSSVVIQGDTSGSVTLEAPAVAGSVVVTLPNTSGTAITSSSLGYNSFKNRIINSAMVIDQRNAGAQITVGTTSTYSVDRFQINKDTVSGTLYAQQSTTAPSGFYNSLLFTANTAWTPATGDLAITQQKIEAFNTSDLSFGSASASTVTLSFWVRSSITGTYSVALLNSANNRSYVATYTVNSANTFEQKTITIAGDTSGTWINGTNGIGIRVNFDLGSGSTYNTTAGAWTAGFFTRTSGSVNWTQTSGATFYITGVQLEKGSTATSFDYRPYTTELQLCQRYYYRIISPVANNNDFGVGFNNNTTQSTLITPFPVPMRSSPTALEQSGTAADYQIIYLATAATCSAVPIFAIANLNLARSTFTVASGLTAGQGSAGRAGVNTTAYLGWSAEL